MLILNFLILMLKCHSNWSKKIINLSNYSFDEFKNELDKYDQLFIYFYAPYCDYCRSSLYEIGQLAEKVNKDLNWSAKIAKIDCTTNYGFQICNEYNIKNYPQLILFKASLVYKTYQGSLDFQSLKKWFFVHTKLASTRFDSYLNLNNKISKSINPLVIGIFVNNRDSLIDEWHKSALKVTKKWTFRNVQFFHIYQDYASGQISDLSSIGLEKLKLLKSCAIVLRRPPWLWTKLEKPNIMFNISSKQDLTQWITQKVFGLVSWRDRSNQDDLKLPLIVAYYDFDFIHRPKFSHYWRDKLVRAARNYTEINFAISNSNTFRKLLSKQNIKPPHHNQNPIFISYDIFGFSRLMNSSYTQINLDFFINPPKSELEFDEKQETNDLVIEVGTANFSRYVTYNHKNVFIMFYTWWCKYYQDFKSIWFRLAEELKGEKYLQFAKMDVVKNQVPFKIKLIKYPTLYLILRKNKKLILYENGSQIHQLVQFLTKHVFQDLQQFDDKGRLKPKVLKDEL